MCKVAKGLRQELGGESWWRERPVCLSAAAGGGDVEGVCERERERD
jgi:hypothetical protein